MLTLVAGLALSSVAQATNPPPRLTAIGAPTVTLEANGERTFSVPFSAIDEGPSGLQEVGITYRLRGSDPNSLAVMSTFGGFWNGIGQTSVTGAIVGTMTKWAPSGTYDVDTVDVVDRAGNRTTYRPGGTDYSEPAGTVVDNFDWASSSFTVNNPNQDVQPPHLTSLGVFESTVAAGQPVVVTYTATDNLSGISTMAVEYEDPQGHTGWAEALGDVAAVGPATWLVPLSAIGGSYKVMMIDVQDNEGNSQMYMGAAAGGGPSGGINPDAADFTVSAVSPDSTAPVLQSITPLSSSSLHPGDEWAFHLSSSDDLTGVVRLSVDYTNGDGVQGQWYQECGNLTDGAIAVVLPSYAATGNWTINDLVLTDGAGNYSIYARDGSLRVQPGNTVTTHTIPISSLDFNVSPGTPSDWPVPSGETITSRCSGASSVGISVPAVSDEPGAGLTVSSHVMRSGTNISQPVSATYERVGARVHLLGIARGSTTGHTVTSTTLNQTTGYFVRFFGEIQGAVTSAPATSATATVHAVSPGEVVAGLDSHRRIAVRRGAAHVGATLSGLTVGASSAVVSAAHRNFYFAVTSTHRIYVRDDWSAWRPLTSGGAACATVSAAATSSALAIACDGTDHHLRTASWSLSTTALPTVRAWTDRGLHAGSGVTLWSDGKTVRAAVSTSNGVLARSLAGTWGKLGVRCAGQPAVTVSGGQTYLACTDASGRLNVLRHRSYGWVNWKTGLAVRGMPALTARPDGTAGLWLVGSDSRCRGITLTSSSTRGRWTVMPGTYLSGTIATYGFV